MEMSALLRKIGMDVPRWRVLMILSEHAPASISTLSERAVINLSTMTKIVQRMEADGLVTAQQRAADARITEVQLTELGHEALARVREQGSTEFRKAFNDIDEEETDLLVMILQRVFTRF